jgi:hypothetical protein
MIKKIAGKVMALKYAKWVIWAILGFGLVGLVTGLIILSKNWFVFGMILSVPSGLILLVNRNGLAGIAQACVVFTGLWCAFYLRLGIGLRTWQPLWFWLRWFLVALLVVIIISMITGAGTKKAKAWKVLKLAIPVLVIWVVWSNWGSIAAWTKGVFYKDGSGRVADQGQSPAPVVPKLPDPSGAERAGGETAKPIPPEEEPPKPVIPAPQAPAGMSPEQFATYMEAMRPIQQAAELNAEVSRQQLQAFAELAKVKEETPEERDERISTEAYKNSAEVKRLETLKPFIVK